MLTFCSENFPSGGSLWSCTYAGRMNDAMYIIVIQGNRVFKVTLYLRPRHLHRTAQRLYFTYFIISVSLVTFPHRRILRASLSTPWMTIDYDVTTVYLTLTFSVLRDVVLGNPEGAKKVVINWSLFKITDIYAFLHRSNGHYVRADLC